MNETVTGIVLKQSDYRDNDIIVTVLTKEYGKLSFIAAGTKKMNSKNGRSVLPCTKVHIRFDYKDGKTMFRLHQIRTENLFRKLHEDLVYTAAGGLACALADRMTLEEFQDDARMEKYDLLDMALSLLNQGEDTDLVLSCLFADYMTVFGIPPQVDACILCGRKQVVVFDPESGGFLCADCNHTGKVWTVQELKEFRLIVKGGLKHFAVIAPLCQNASGYLDVLYEMFHRFSGIDIKAYTFYVNCR